MSIVSPINPHQRQFRRTSINFKPFVPPIMVPNTPRQRSLSITRPEMSRPVTSRTILKSLPQTANPEAFSILPSDPETVLKLLGNYLSEYEHTEILDYDKICYIGKFNKIRGKMTDRNWGYDTNKGEYLLLKSDHIEYRYEILDSIGKGTFGQVCKCFDHLLKELVAIKIVKNKPKLNRQAMIEIKILKTLNKSDPSNTENIVRFKNSFTFRSHICMVFELLGINLYEYSKISMFKQFNFPMLQNLARQMLRAIRFMHMNDIVHCDLKPENVIMTNGSGNCIKIIDFGSSCYVNERLYSYIQSRYYRAPEVVMGIPYGPPIDMWSFGCILVELYVGYPLFPADDESQLLGKMIEVLGMPPQSLVFQCKRKKINFDDEKNGYREKCRNGMSRTLVEIIGLHDLAFVDFIKEIVVWDPKQRITAEIALNHNWLKKNYNKPQRKAFKKESFLSPEFAINKLYFNS